MKQLFLMVKDGNVKLLDTPAPIVKENTVVVETLYSVVSAGTERSLASFGEKNLVQKALERPDQVLKLTEKISTDGVINTIQSAFNRLAEPMPMGYSGVGRVKECGKGVTFVMPGDIVAMVGQAYHSEVNRVSSNLIAKIPSGETDYKQYAFAALAGIALEGIHQSEVTPGETVAIIGLGLLGHITARILNAYGCNVIAFDIVDKSLEQTHLTAFISSEDDNAVDIVKSLTRGRGVDCVIITAATDSNKPMDLAAAISRDRGIICMIGVTNMNIDRRPFYEKELTFKIARSYGPGRYDAIYEDAGIDYPIGYVRFTEGRNIEEFVRLLTNKLVDFNDLITHVIPFEEAENAYEMLTVNKQKEKYIAILLEYSINKEKWESIVRAFPMKKKIKSSTLSIGLIGAGNFVKNTMLPIMKSMDEFYFKGLATTGGTYAAQTNEMFPFEYVTNDYKNLLADKDIDLIVISTQHNTHAKFILEALKAGKNVYCEKPICLTLKQLASIKKAYQNSDGELFCGMNRRYAPMARKIKSTLKTDKIPAVYNYIVNAGYIPDNHWIQDEKTGGGRIVGEACHFIDLIQYLDGSKLKDIKIEYAENPAYPKKDNASITLSFESGSIGLILYTSMGSKKYPKEQLSVFSNGTVFVMDNYVKLLSYGNNKRVKVKLKQDKGFLDEYKYIYDVLNSNKTNLAILDVFDSMYFLLRGES